MKITFITDANLHLASAEGTKSYDFKAGETANVPADVAAYFINGGYAKAVGAEKATKAKGETATK